MKKTIIEFPANNEDNKTKRGGMTVTKAFKAYCTDYIVFKNLSSKTEEAEDALEAVYAQFHTV